MTPKVNDFVIRVGTVNGSGSQSSNLVLVKSLFRSGLPVNGKNLFPSNIAGLPTWFSIRVNDKGHLGRTASNDLVVAMNGATFEKDSQSVSPGGVFLYNSDLPHNPQTLRDDVLNIGVPYRKLVGSVTDLIKLKKLLTNMIYVGIVAECLAIESDVVTGVIQDQLKSKSSLVDVNIKAIKVGREFARSEIDVNQFPLKIQSIANGNRDRVLMDGNTAAGLGLLFGGCTFLSWYPITPSSSLVENFHQFSEKYGKNSEGQRQQAIVQAEDELSAISMVLGAGWAGARAATATSGPGLSLMAEAAGLSYFAEVPAVIWDVQRVGPSTGLPTRTMQGDVLAAARLSHGDTRQVLLFPSSPKECFEFGQVGLDLSERLQTLVIVLSDLDLGMNLWIDEEFDYPTRPYDRGKVLTREALNQVDEFARYRDVDGDGICYRTLPGTDHPKAAFFARGTGHDEKAAYSEDNEIFKAQMDRLVKKWEAARTLVPRPEIDEPPTSDIAIIAYGSTDFIMNEAREILEQKGITSSYLRLKAYPFTAEVEDYIHRHERVYVVEQNRDHQMRTLIETELNLGKTCLNSVLQYDGLPLEAQFVANEISQQEELL